MARFLRATFLLTLGVAAPVLPAGTAVAANTGGAAPGSAVTVSSSASGGASTTPTSSSASVPKGAAAPGDKPAQTSTSKTAGGAVPGKPPHRRVVKRRPKPPAKTPAKAKRKPAPTQPTTPPPITPVSPTVAGVFPLIGAYDFGGDDARFGAGRTGHIHQGQDVIAASGTPIVAPVSGSVLWKANQEGGAGIYLVVHGSDGRDYVFMHIKRGTVQVAVGDAVTAGQQMAQVGATGDASGPHLHFEIWVGGWYVKGGAPLDPLPQLQRWAGLPPS